MSAKVVKVVAVPMVLGFASVRVYAMSESKTEHLLSPHELSIYSSEAEGRLRFVEEQQGSLQSGFGKVRGGLQSCVQSIKGAFLSVKVTAVNLYHGGEDIYHFLKDPPPGFVPRVAVIFVSGLAGVVLARKGSRLKRLGLPLSLASAGFGVCYPVQTISILKVSGKKLYAASHWTSSTVASLWKSPTALPATSESAQSTEALSKDKPNSEGAEAAGKEEASQEIPPTDQSSFTPGSEEDGSATEHSVPYAEEELLKKEISPPSSFQTNESQPETSSLQPSEESKTPTEKQKHVVDQTLMDFGQSNPEDADLYSTRS